MEGMQQKIAELAAQLTDLDLKYEESERTRKELEGKVNEAERVAAEAARGAPGGGAGSTGSSIDTRGLGTVSYTHLTLPTKRIV